MILLLNSDVHELRYNNSCFNFPDRKVFLAMWKDIPASNEVQKQFHCNFGSGKQYLLLMLYIPTISQLINY